MLLSDTAGEILGGVKVDPVETNLPAGVRAQHHGTDSLRRILQALLHGAIDLLGDGMPMLDRCPT